MKTMMIILFILFAAMATGCGAGGDMKFSPDPSISSLFNEDGDEQPAGVPPEAGGQPPQGDGENTDAPEDEITSDCFANGFCHRDCGKVSDCPSGFSCIMKVCTFDCQSDGECGNGGVCNSMGLCEALGGEAMSACKLDDECGEGRFCNAVGTCEKVPVVLGCQDDVDCPFGQYCNESHSCTPFIGTDSICKSDSECPSNYYCGLDGKCTQDCRVDRQCGDGLACGETGKCVAVGKPSKIVSFNFNALGSSVDPTGSAIFSGQKFKIDSATITIAGRNAVLSSPRFKLTGSMEY